MIYALNVANEPYRNAQKFNTKTAYRYGADKVFEFSLSDIDAEFAEKNRRILNLKRGAGYWLWKPYFINRVMQSANDEDWIIYSDSGMVYRKRIDKYIAELEKKGIHFISRCTKFQEKQFTKRDVFIELGCDQPEYTDTLQRAASAIVLKNTENNRKFVGEWLDKAQNYHWITDDSNRDGLPNYNEFTDHRHDQSIFSLLCKKYNKDYNRNLFLDMVLPLKNKALLSDHHSKSGNYVLAYTASIKRNIIVIYHILVSKISRK